MIGDRRVIRAHDDAVRATLEWIEKDLLQTRGWDPMTRQHPRVAANGMIVAGFRHVTSRIGDPQLHTHCVLANMTRNAAGEWRSVELTKIRRSEKLIGAYYRNELARRVEALGMAVTPRMIGRVPGFELAGYDRSFMDAFSGRRAEILAYLKEHDLPYNAKNAEMAALRTRQAKKEIGLSQLVPQWRERAREFGLVRDRGRAPAGPADRSRDRGAGGARRGAAAGSAGQRAPEPEARAGRCPGCRSCRARAGPRRGGRRSCRRCRRRGCWRRLHGRCRMWPSGGRRSRRPRSGRSR